MKDQRPHRKSNLSVILKLVGTLLLGQLLFTATSLAQAPQFRWAKEAQNVGTLGYVRKLALDGAGNFYLSGYFDATNVSFFGSSPTNAITQGLFLAKYDHWGNLQWLTQPLGTNGANFADQVWGMVCAPNGDLYMTGSFSETLSVAGVTLSDLPYLSTACFLTRFDANGNALWAVQSLGSGSDDNNYAANVALDSQTNVYIAGTFTSPTIQFGGLVLTNTTVSYSTPAGFLVKYDSAGNALWARQAGPNHDTSLAMAADPAGNTWLAGCFYTNVSFAGMSLTNPNPANQIPVFIAKFDTSGNSLWAKAVNASADISGSVPPIALAVDGAGNSYLTGGYDSTNASFDNILLINPHIVPAGYTTEVFVAKYDPAGNALWARQGGGISQDLGISIALDASTNCYVTGFLSGEWTNAINFDSITLPNEYSFGYPIPGLGFIAKYDSAGDILWAKDFSAQPCTAAVDPYGTALVAGYVEFTNAFFDSIELLDSDPIRDLFMAKLDGPQLSAAALGNQLLLSWPTNAVGMSLESTADLSSDAWLPVTNLPAVNGNQFNVTCNITNPAAFFRLNNR